VGDGWFAACEGWDGDLEDAKLVLLHGMRLSIPLVEVADQRRLDGIGSPFSVDNGAVV